MVNTRRNGYEEEDNREEDREDSGANMSAEELARLVNTAVETILARRPEQEEIRRLRQEVETLQARVAIPPEVTAQQRREMRRMQEEIARLQEANGLRTDATPRGSPLSQQILAVPLPTGFSFPEVGRYDGSTDPGEHLARFENAAHLHQCAEAIKCRVFPMTLVGAAQSWFQQMPEGGVTGFPEFARSFLQQFASSKKQPATPFNLLSVKQQDRESIREYVKRLSRILLDVPSVTPDLLVGAFTRGLREGDLFMSLVKRPPTTFEGLLAKAEKYINLEEADLARRIEGRHPGRNTRENADTRGPPRGRRPEMPLLVGPAVRQISLKVISKSRALQICEERNLLSRPLGPRGFGRPATDAYCDFHRAYGHATESCRTLEEELERITEQNPDVGAAILAPVPAPQQRRARREERPPAREQREGRRRSRTPPREPPRARPHPQGRPGRGYGGNRRRQPLVRTPPRNQIPRGVIRMISGGPTYGDSNRARKAGRRRMESMGVSVSRRIGGPTISFGPDDFHGGTSDHDDALVISAMIANYMVERIFVDNGSSVNVLFKDAMDRMDLGNYHLGPVETDLYGFTGHSLQPLGVVHLPMTLGEVKTCVVPFIVVDLSSSYNVIFGRPAITIFGAIPSALHQKMKFPVGRRVGEVLGDRRMARKCYVEEVRAEKKAAKSRRDDGPSRCARDYLYSIDATGPLTTEEETEEIVLQRPSGSVRVARSLPHELREGLIQCLRRNKDVFAWTVADFRGIDREVIEHQLNVAHEARPVFQKKRSFGAEQNEAIREQIRELTRAGHIREVQFPTWLSNVVMVPKAGGKWRMCVDFRDLNKACPKDCYPLPRIDQLVDSTAGHEFLCFLDAYQGYHQIKLAREDQEKVSFVTNEGTFCYNVMPFGLKNAGATYQRLMDKVFKEQIGRNVEVYVDDILIKSREASCLLSDLEETFHTARRYKLKLNPTKCTFGVRTGKFLGYMVTRRGIEANPEKVRAIATMTSPRSVNDVQKLAGRITALSRFISRSAERSLPFFKVLRKTKKFEWDEQSERAFLDLKEYLKTLPILNKPQLGEELLVYLAITPQAVSSVLVRSEGTIHHPVYFVSYALKGSELNYTTPEKLALALVLTARRLRPYFLSHPIIVLTNRPLGKILSQPDVSGRLIKWATELGEFDIRFKPRTSVKAQVLADFIAEMVETVPEESWRVRVDGSSCRSGCGVGVVLTSPWGEETNLAVRLDFRGSNNVAEYEALMIGLRAVRVLGATRVVLQSDSELVVQQANGNFATRDEKMARYARALEKLRGEFEEVHQEHVPREENEKADGLAKLASSLLTTGETGDVVYELVSQIERLSMTVRQIEREDWRYDIYNYLTDHTLPEDASKARDARRRSSRFVLIDGTLYKRSFSRPLLRCISSTEAEEVLREIHEGICGSHLGSVALSRKALLAGFFWPTMQKDALALVRSCRSCQVHANLQQVPVGPMRAVLSSCPFDQWGIDLVGPLPTASGQRRHLIVAIDYSKWIDAKAVAKTTQEDLMAFIWKNIICRFGIPRRIVSDNGPQFRGREMRNWCEELKIEQVFTSVYHPQSNGQVEVTNRTIIQALKARIEGVEGRGADELQSVLWSLRTTPQAGTNETPFSLVYGSEAVLPAEIGQESARVSGYSDDNRQLRAMELDFAQERRSRAEVRMAAYRERIARAYNRKANLKKFEVGDRVMREMQPKFEGPFTVIAKAGVAAYHLEDAHGRKTERPWNARLLRKYYP